MFGLGIRGRQSHSHAWSGHETRWQGRTGVEKGREWRAEMRGGGEGIKVTSPQGQPTDSKKLNFGQTCVGIPEVIGNR